MCGSASGVHVDKGILRGPENCLFELRRVSSVCVPLDSLQKVHLRCPLQIHYLLATFPHSFESSSDDGV